MTLIPRDNNPAELKAFEDTCERLAGFDGALNFEFADGFLTALATGAHVPPAEAWLPALCGDAFERAFADPEAHAQALKSLRTRLVVLQDQLDAEVLFVQPNGLRLRPLMDEWTEEHRQALLAAGTATEAELGDLLTGAVWAEGFMHAVKSFPELWPEPGDAEAAAVRAELFGPVELLLMREDSEPYRAYMATYFGAAGALPTRDDLIDEACFTVQELRLWVVENAPLPATRRVDKTPGRNDPCPCGSGRKYKKCHGA